VHLVVLVTMVDLQMDLVDLLLTQQVVVVELVKLAKQFKVTTFLVVVVTGLHTQFALDHL
jgi:hypothetical protein